MNRSIRKLFYTLAIVICCSALQNALSDSLRYIDESGNIFFVDSIGEVPAKYRIQINPPTPTPSLSKRQAAQYQAQVKKLENQRERERRRREKELQKEIKKQQGKTGTAMSSGKKPSKGTDMPRKKEAALFFTSPNCPICEQEEIFLSKSKIPYVKHDIVKSAVSFQLFDSLDAGSELPVAKFGKTIIKGFVPAALLAAAQGKTLQSNPEDLASASNNPADQVSAVTPRDEDNAPIAAMPAQ